MYTKQTEVFSFFELSDDAKQHAVANWRKMGIEFDFSAEYIIDDFKQQCFDFGFEISKIYYSGFWSQGDGASFEGTYKYKKGWKRNYLNNYRDSDSIFDVFGQIADIARRHFFRDSVTVNQRGHYYHENTVYTDNDDYTDFFRDLAWILYKRLEEEWEYQNLDSTIVDYLQDSIYEFDIDGDMI